MKYQYDLLVIGSGSSGFAAASSAKGRGRKIGIIEEEKSWGGECPNWACVPTKSLLKSAKVFRDLKSSAIFGIKAKSIELDFAMVMARRAKIAGALSGRRVEDIAESIGVDRIKGHATFLDKHTVQVGDEKFTSDKFIIATGSKTFIPHIPGLDRVDWIDYRTAVEFKSLPESMIIVGAGAVGCELATIFASFGSKVILIQASDRILSKEEPEISSIAHDSLVRLGVVVHLGSEVLQIEGTGDIKKLRVRVRKDIINVESENLLMATGKVSTTAGLGLGAVGVKLDDKGSIITNAELRTSADNIWSAGDVVGGMRFTHTAHYEGSIAGHNAFAGKSGVKIDERVVPRVTFLDPEIASVGLTEAEARASDAQVIVGAFQIKGIGRSFIEGEEYGLVKLVADKTTRKILGGHVACVRAGEMIHEIAIAMYAKSTIDDLAQMIHAYPTYSEGIVAAAVDAIS